MIRCEVIGDCRLYLGDCRDVMPTLGKFDLLLTDPPYGIGFGNFNRTNKLANGERVKADKYHNSNWDDEFCLDEFYKQFQEKSDKLIIWGGNYFPCLWDNPVKSIIFWHKHQPVSNFSKGELAWTNIGFPAQFIDYPYYGNIEGRTKATEKQHPTQKPVNVMLECLNLADNPQTVFDPFMGSGTTGVACANMGKQFTGIEREVKYFDIACKRIEDAYRQTRMFA